MINDIAISLNSKRRLVATAEPDGRRSATSGLSLPSKFTPRMTGPKAEQQ
jgi:hypothetical protein